MGVDQQVEQGRDDGLLVGHLVLGQSATEGEEVLSAGHHVGAEDGRCLCRAGPRQRFGDGDGHLGVADAKEGVRAQLDHPGEHASGQLEVGGVAGGAVPLEEEFRHPWGVVDSGAVRVACRPAAGRSGVIDQVRAGEARPAGQRRLDVVGEPAEVAGPLQQDRHADALGAVRPVGPAAVVDGQPRAGVDRHERMRQQSGTLRCALVGEDVGRPRLHVVAHRQVEEDLGPCTVELQLVAARPRCADRDTAVGGTDPESLRGTAHWSTGLDADLRTHRGGRRGEPCGRRGVGEEGVHVAVPVQRPRQRVAAPRREDDRGLPAEGRRVAGPVGHLQHQVPADVGLRHRVA